MSELSNDPYLSWRFSLIANIHKDGGEVGHHEDIEEVPGQYKGDRDDRLLGRGDVLHADLPALNVVLAHLLGALIAQQARLKPGPPVIGALHTTRLYL